MTVRRYRITSSHFGEVLHHLRDTPPDRLYGVKHFDAQEILITSHHLGIENESKAIQAYIEHKQSCGISELTVGPCGFFICEGHPFVRATPDGTVYDPSNLSHPFRFLEGKCLYSLQSS